MRNNKQISLSEQIADLELANKTLRNYAQGLEEKLAGYERILQRCPKFRMTPSEAAKSVCSDKWLVVPDEPFQQVTLSSRPSRPLVSPTTAPDFNDFEDDDFEDDDFEDDDWDGLEESDFIDDWEEEY